MTITSDNKKSFKSGEAVALTVEVKNIPKLTVEVYEINSENYYRKHKAELRNDINLDGLIASDTTSIEFTSPPIVK